MEGILLALVLDGINQGGPASEGNQVRDKALAETKDGGFRGGQGSLGAGTLASTGSEVGDDEGMISPFRPSHDGLDGAGPAVRYHAFCELQK